MSSNRFDIPVTQSSGPYEDEDENNASGNDSVNYDQIFRDLNSLKDQVKQITEIVHDDSHSEIEKVNSIKNLLNIELILDDPLGDLQLIQSFQASIRQVEKPQLTSKVDKIINKMNELTTERDFFKSEFERLKKIIDEQKTPAQPLRDSLGEQLETVIRRKSEDESKNTNRHSKKMEKVSTHAKEAELINEIVRLNQRVKTLQKDIERMRERALQSDRGNAEKIGLREVEITSLKQRNNELVRQLETNGNNLREANLNLSQKNIQIIRLQNEIKDQQAMIGRLPDKGEVQRLRSEIEQKQVQIQNLKREIQRQQTEIEISSERERAEAAQRIAEIQRQLQDITLKNNEIQRQETLIANLRSQNENQERGSPMKKIMKLIQKQTKKMPQQQKFKFSNQLILALGFY